MAACGTYEGQAGSFFFILRWVSDKKWDKNDLPDTNDGVWFSSNINVLRYKRFAAFNLNYSIVLFIPFVLLKWVCN